MGQVRRLLRCDSCGFQFELRQMKGDPLPESCPDCGVGEPEHDAEREFIEGEERIARMVEEGRAPAIGGTPIAKAAKIAEDMMRESGMSDWNDSGKAGERAAKGPSPMHTAEIEQITREMVQAKVVSESQASEFAQGAQNFWQTAPVKEAKSRKKIITPNGMPVGAPSAAQTLALGAAGAAEARQAGVDPIALLHKSPDRGMKLNVMARATK